MARPKQSGKKLYRIDVYCDADDYKLICAKAQSRRQNLSSFVLSCAMSEINRNPPRIEVFAQVREIVREELQKTLLEAGNAPGGQSNDKTGGSEK